MGGNYEGHHYQSQLIERLVFYSNWGTFYNEREFFNNYAGTIANIGSIGTNDYPAYVPYPYNEEYLHGFNVGE